MKIERNLIILTNIPHISRSWNHVLFKNVCCRCRLLLFSPVFLSAKLCRIAANGLFCQCQCLCLPTNVLFENKILCYDYFVGRKIVTTPNFYIFKWTFVGKQSDEIHNKRVVLRLIFPCVTACYFSPRQAK